MSLTLNAFSKKNPITVSEIAEITGTDSANVYKTIIPKLQKEYKIYFDKGRSLLYLDPALVRAVADFLHAVKDAADKHDALLEKIEKTDPYERWCRIKELAKKIGKPLPDL